ncbi:superoxide dismutase Fe-Mn family, partial [Fusarium mexicanum]
MASALLRSTPALRAGLRARSTPLAAMATTSFVRNKATLPDLPCTTPPTPIIPDLH